MIKVIKELNGHSGCKILLCFREYYFVRKISKSVDYNLRLKKQMNKQIYFYNELSTDRITCPRVITHGYIENLFYFDMEYIRGTTYIEKIANANLVELKKIPKELIELISFLKTNSPIGEKISLSKKFISKIDELKKIIPPKYQSYLEQLRIKSYNLPDIVSTWCHGDFVLENIIYDNEKQIFYFIDFQDLFANHYWFDISLIFQDIDEAWYLFKHPEFDGKIMKIKMDFIKREIMPSIENEYLSYHSLFMAMKFLRIIPYSDKKDHDYLITVVEKHLS